MRKQKSIVDTLFASSFETSTSWLILLLELQNFLGNLFIFWDLAVFTEQVAYDEDDEEIDDQDLNKGNHIYDWPVLEATVTLGVEIADLEACDHKQNVKNVEAACIVSTNFDLQSNQGNECNDEVDHVEQDHSVEDVEETTAIHCVLQINSIQR